MKKNNLKKIMYIFIYHLNKSASYFSNNFFVFGKTDQLRRVF